MLDRIRGALGATLASTQVGGVEVTNSDGDDFQRAPALTSKSAHSVVWACVRDLSSSVGRSVWKSRFAGGSLTTNDAALRRLERPHPDWSGLEFWTFVAARLVADGNAYLIDSGAAAGGGWTPALSGTVTRENGRRIYKLQTLDGQSIERTAAQVLPIHGPGYNGLESPSPIAAAAASALASDQAARTLQLANAKSGLHGRGVLLVDPVGYSAMTRGQRGDIARTLEKNYTAQRGAGRIPVLPPGVTPGTMGGVSPADLQLIELMKWNAYDVCRALGVPPRNVFLYDRGMRVTGFEMQASDYQRQSVEPLCARISAVMTRAIVPTGGKQFVLDSSDLSLGTFSEQVESLTKAVAGGLLTPNEARAKMAVPPHADGERLILPAGSPGTAPGNNPPEPR